MRPMQALFLVHVRLACRASRGDVCVGIMLRPYMASPSGLHIRAATFRHPGFTFADAALDDFAASPLRGYASYAQLRWRSVIVHKVHAPVGRGQDCPQ